MIIEIQPTPEDVAAGERGDCEACPYALAATRELKAVFPRVRLVRALSKRVVVVSERPSGLLDEVDVEFTNGEVTIWMKLFDDECYPDRCPPEPPRLTINLPPSLVADLTQPAIDVKPEHRPSEDSWKP